MWALLDETETNPTRHSAEPDAAFSPLAAPVPPTVMQTFVLEFGRGPRQLDARFTRPANVLSALTALFAPTAPGIFRHCHRESFELIAHAIVLGASWSECPTRSGRRQSSSMKDLRSEASVS